MNVLFVLTACGVAALLAPDCARVAANPFQYFSIGPGVKESTTPALTESTLNILNLPATSDIPPRPKEPVICGIAAPCGWAVYTKYTRTVEYFVANVCGCAVGKTCQKADDDLSISAYVYRCGPFTTSTEKIPIHN